MPSAADQYLQRFVDWCRQHRRLLGAAGILLLIVIGLLWSRRAQQTMTSQSQSGGQSSLGRGGDAVPVVTPLPIIERTDSLPSDGELRAVTASPTSVDSSPTTASTSPSTGQQRWVEYHSPSDGFTLAFPSVPEFEFASVDFYDFEDEDNEGIPAVDLIMNTSTYTSDDDTSAYNLHIQAFTTSDGVPVSDLLNLNNYAQLTGSQPDETTTLEYGTYQGLPTIEYTTGDASVGVYVRGRTVFAPDALFSLSVISVDPNLPYYDFYVNSLNIEY